MDTDNVILFLVKSQVFRWQFRYSISTRNLELTHFCCCFLCLCLLPEGNQSGELLALHHS